jgi:hypothetical protein
MAKHRKSHRRRSTKKSRRTRRRMMYGGNPANVGSYALGAKDLPQGNQFLQMHQGQHGGAAPLSVMGQSLIPPSLNDSARVAATYAQYGQIANMKDQTGGRRRRRGKKSRKTRRSRKMRGGAYALSPAEVAWKEAISVPQGVNPQFASWNAAA